MMDMNKVCLTGRLVGDMKQRTTTDCQIGDFNIAVDGCSRKDQKQENMVSFFNCILYGQRVETTSPFMTKGKKVGIVGHLRQDRWEHEGQKKSRAVIIAEQVFLLSGDQRSSTKFTDEEMDKLPF